MIDFKCIDISPIIASGDQATMAQRDAIEQLQPITLAVFIQKLQHDACNESRECGDRIVTHLAIIGLSQVLQSIKAKQEGDAA